MDKISINLNPQKEKVPSAALEKMLSYTSFLVLIAIAGVALVLFLQLFSLLRLYTYKKYSKVWDQWESKAVLIKDTKNEIKALEEEKKALVVVATPKYQAISVLEDIFSSLPENIWLKELRLQDGALRLEGYAVKWKKDYLLSLDDFVGSLSKKDYFSSKFTDTQIKESRKEYFNNAEVLHFTIECKS